MSGLPVVAYNNDAHLAVRFFVASKTVGLTQIHLCLPKKNLEQIILREVVTAAGKAYEVIGEAYVESLSHGEVEDLSGLKPQEFRLV